MNADVPGMKIVHAWANDYDADTCKTFGICIIATVSNGLPLIKNIGNQKLGEMLNATR